MCWVNNLKMGIPQPRQTPSKPSHPTNLLSKPRTQVSNQDEDSTEHGPDKASGQ
jgi:hypothetical protein